MEEKSKWWGVSLDDEEDVPRMGPPEYVPPMRFENKKVKPLPKESKGKVVRRIGIRFPVSLHSLVRGMKGVSLRVRIPR